MCDARSFCAAVSFRPKRGGVGFFGRRFTFTSVFSPCITLAAQGGLKGTMLDAWAWLQAGCLTAGYRKMLWWITVQRKATKPHCPRQTSGASLASRITACQRAASVCRTNIGTHTYKHYCAVNTPLSREEPRGGPDLKSCSSAISAQRKTARANTTSGGARVDGPVFRRQVWSLLGVPGPSFKSSVGARSCFAGRASAP